MLAQRPVRKTGNVDGRAAVTRFRCYAARGRAAFPPDLAELGSGGDGGDERDCSRRPPAERPYRTGRFLDWIKVKNPDAPAATRVIENGKS
jgi:hypothetical protein